MDFALFTEFSLSISESAYPALWKEGRPEQQMWLGFIARVESCKLGRIGCGKKMVRSNHQELSKAFKK
jgi:hypothetical protein